jgi:hypothetical protein
MPNVRDSRTGTVIEEFYYLGDESFSPAVGSPS